MGAKWEDYMKFISGPRLARQEALGRIGNIAEGALGVWAENKRTGAMEKMALAELEARRQEAEAERTQRKWEIESDPQREAIKALLARRQGAPGAQAQDRPVVDLREAMPEAAQVGPAAPAGLVRSDNPEVQRSINALNAALGAQAAPSAPAGLDDLWSVQAAKADVGRIRAEKSRAAEAKAAEDDAALDEMLGQIAGLPPSARATERREERGFQTGLRRTAQVRSLAEAEEGKKNTNAAVIESLERLVGEAGSKAARVAPTWSTNFMERGGLGASVGRQLGVSSVQERQADLGQSLDAIEQLIRQGNLKTADKIRLADILRQIKPAGGYGTEASKGQIQDLIELLEP